MPPQVGQQGLGTARGDIDVAPLASGGYPELLWGRRGHDRLLFRGDTVILSHWCPFRCAGPPREGWIDPPDVKQGKRTITEAMQEAGSSFQTYDELRFFVHGSAVAMAALKGRHEDSVMALSLANRERGRRFRARSCPCERFLDHRGGQHHEMADLSEGKTVSRSCACFPIFNLYDKK
jgi:hypothetical protein